MKPHLSPQHLRVLTDLVAALRDNYFTWLHSHLEAQPLSLGALTLVMIPAMTFWANYMLHHFQVHVEQ